MIDMAKLNHRIQARIGGRWNAHVERFVGVPWNVEPYDFDGNFATLECALKYLTLVQVACHLRKLVAVIFEFHRIRDQLVGAAKLA